MANTCATEVKDLVDHKRTSLLFWGLPLMAFILGALSSPPWRTGLWTISLAVSGTACLVNASRCGRLHCYLTGPFFIGGAIVSLGYGLGWLALGPQGWLWIGVTVIAGAAVLVPVPELIWGKYVSCGKREP